MNAETIREFVNRRPFEPFEVIMSSGERHPVRHPECLMILPSRAVIGDPVADRVAHVSLMHVTELRVLNAQRSQGE